MRFAVGAVVLLSACVPKADAEDATARGETCGADQLQEFVDGPVTAYDFDALEQPVRIIGPNSMVTMDHRPDRVNVETDENDVITRIYCG